MKNRGFTLIEMVLTMVVGGIIVLGIAGFVELGTKGYADSIDRQRMQTQAQFVIVGTYQEIDLRSWLRVGFLFLSWQMLRFERRHFQCEIQRRYHNLWCTS